MLKLFAESIPSSEQIELVQIKLKTILSACEPTRILLIGSAARLAMTDASDIDVVVIVADQTDLKKTNSEINRRRDLKTDAWPQDLLIVTESEFRKKASFGGVYFVAATDGVELFPDFKLGQTEK